jgi:hypothetical protein
VSQAEYLWRMIESLHGLQLRSLRGDQFMYVSRTDRTRGRIELVIRDKVVRRHFGEIFSVWNQLVSRGFVHVDSALRGSGSSRNQPETLLAAFPCVEWAILEGRKHLVLRPADTHALGTTKEVDEFLRERLEREHRHGAAPLVALVVGGDLSTQLGVALGGEARLSTLSNGLVLLTAPDRKVLGVDSGGAGGLSEGIYLLSPCDFDEPQRKPFVSLGGVQLFRSQHRHVINFKGALWDG